MCKCLHILTKNIFLLIYTIDVPGGMNDKSAGRYIAKNAPSGSILVDEGYTLTDARFIGPPAKGTPLEELHKAQRAIVERYLGQLKNLWKMVGTVYRLKRQYHGLVIRCAVILTNMMIVHEGGLSK